MSSIRVLSKKFEEVKKEAATKVREDRILLEKIYNAIQEEIIRIMKSAAGQNFMAYQTDMNNLYEDLINIRKHRLFTQNPGKENLDNFINIFEELKKSVKFPIKSESREAELLRYASKMGRALKEAFGYEVNLLKQEELNLR